MATITPRRYTFPLCSVDIAALHEPRKRGEQGGLPRERRPAPQLRPPSSSLAVGIEYSQALRQQVSAGSCTIQAELSRKSTWYGNAQVPRCHTNCLVFQHCRGAKCNDNRLFLSGRTAGCARAPPSSRLTVDRRGQGRRGAAAILPLNPARSAPSACTSPPSRRRSRRRSLSSSIPVFQGTCVAPVSFADPCARALSHAWRRGALWFSADAAAGRVSQRS